MTSTSPEDKFDCFMLHAQQGMLHAQQAFVQYFKGMIKFTIGRLLMAHNRHTSDILNVNVGGKRYTVRRIDLLADPKSKLAEWFKPGSGKQIATDKGGNYYLDRDSKTFRHILAYLRLKKDKFVLSLALPAKPDDLAKLVAECEALNMTELKNLALDVLQKYQQTEEQHYVTSFVQIVLRDYETWQFHHEHSTAVKKGKGGSTEMSSGVMSAYDEWDDL